MSSKLSFSIPSSKSKPKPKPKPEPEDSSSQYVAAFDSKVKDEEEAAAAATTSSKLSFAIPSSRVRPRPEGDGSRNDEENKIRLFVTEFDSSKTLDDADKGKSVIAPIQNTWRPTKRMKNLELPLTEAANSEAIGFVVESLPTAGDGGDEGITYGLNVREKSGRDGRGDPERMLLEKLRYDMENLPEHRGMEEFEDRPVEGFGAALLAGYGWKEGQVVGRNKNRDDVEVKQYEKRAGKLGLGFMADKPDAVGSKDRDRYKERSRDRKDERDSKKDERDSRKDEKDSRKDERDSRKDARDSRNDEKDSRKDARDCSSRMDERDSRKDAKDSSSRKEQVGKRVAWLRRRIRVRVVSKKLKGGKLYLKKGVVVDVVGQHVCDISMDGSRELVQGVDQDCLETALPRKGGVVVVLFGEHKGVHGSLVRKDSDRGVVEDSRTLELLNVKLDQVAEYVGDPE